MKKVVLIVSNLYKPNIGGVENSLFHLAQSYLAMGYRPIICASDIHAGNESLPLSEIADGIEIERYRVNEYGGVKRFSMHWMQGIKLFRRLKKQHQPVLVVSRFHQSCLMLKLAGFQKVNYLVPGVVAFQNSAQHLTSNGVSFTQRLKRACQYRLHTWLQRWAFFTAHRLFVFSINMARQIRCVASNNGDKLYLTKPGVDTSRFHPLTGKEKLQLRESLSLTTENTVFLCVGRFVAAKGFDLAIAAMAKLDDAELWLLGSGEEIAAYNEQIESLGLQQKVRILPPSSHPEHYYAASDAFIMSSRYEPLGQTILEALASGLPVIAFSAAAGVTTATNELLSDDYPYFASELSADALGRRMAEIQQLTTTQQYTEVCAEMRQLAQRKFSWDSLAETLLTPPMTSRI